MLGDLFWKSKSDYPYSFFSFKKILYGRFLNCLRNYLLSPKSKWLPETAYLDYLHLHIPPTDRTNILKAVHDISNQFNSLIDLNDLSDLNDFFSLKIFSIVNIKNRQDLIFFNPH